MNTERFELYQWSTKAMDLLKRAKQCLKTAQSEKLELLADRIPTEVLKDDKKIKLVFAGQYSAGKSTIIKVLTENEDIEIGAGITTEQTHFYEWGGINIIDTPGIHTQIRPEHDEITYRAISEADLLVFVVTNELFDSHLGKHFRDLAIDRDKAHEMMLVVNKMMRCTKGNTPESQNVIREDLRKVLSPFTPEDLRITFIDAESALKSKSEPDEELAKILWKKSGFNEFIRELNKFIREKGLTSRYTTALYTLDQILNEALAIEPSDDKDIDALKELLLRRHKIFLDTYERILSASKNEIEKVKTQVIQEGQRISNMIDFSADENYINKEIRKAQEHVQELTDQLGKKIENIIGTQIDNLAKRIDDIIGSELAQQLTKRLDNLIKNISISPETSEKLKLTADISARLGKFLISHSYNTAGLGGLFNLSRYSGTATHGVVKSVGHFFGKSFKPWEAVKWTRTLANAGRFLSVAGLALSFFSQKKEDEDEKKLEKELREARIAIKNAFNESAHAIEMHYDEATKSYVSSNLTSEKEEIDLKLKELRDLQERHSNFEQCIISVLEEVNELIRNIHVSKF